VNLEITEDFFPGLVKYLDTERAVLEEIPGVKVKVEVEVEEVGKSNIFLKVVKCQK